MLRTNEDKLIQMPVLGEVLGPLAKMPPYQITADGRPVVLPSLGGITLNLRVGDLAVGWMGDHVEPAVSTKYLGKGGNNAAYNVLSCAGNDAVVISGDAKGAKGVVTGKHGGAEHVIIDFDERAMRKLNVGDKIKVWAHGCGLELLDFPEVKVMNISPKLLKAWKIKADKKNHLLHVPVTHTLPAAIMGSGLGSVDCHTGDYDIQLFDEKIVKKHKLDTLRFGDFVAIMDADHSFGRIFKTGAVSIGIIVHSDCVLAGHGPGLMTVLTSSEGIIRPVIDPHANIGRYLRIGRFSRKK